MVDGSLAVIIGANKGAVLNDPSFAALSQLHAVHKIFVEPIPYLFRELEQNIRGMPNATAVNAAISSGGKGSIDMFCVMDPNTGAVNSTGVPFFANQVCSIHRERLHTFDMLRFARADTIQSAIRRVTVPTLSLSQLLRTHANGMSLANGYLQIDAEGHDEELVWQALSLTQPPAQLTFETMLISAPRLEELHRKLIAQRHACCVLDAQNWRCRRADNGAGPRPPVTRACPGARRQVEEQRALLRRQGQTSEWFPAPPRDSMGLGVWSCEQYNASRLLITGCGRSGTHSIARMLGRAGLRIGHEFFGDASEGHVSWFSTGLMRSVAFHSRTRCHCAILKTHRAPLHAIDSIVQGFNGLGSCSSDLLVEHDSASWRFAAQYVTLPPVTEPSCGMSRPKRLQLALHYWVKWNILADSVATDAIDVESATAESLISARDRRCGLQQPGRQPSALISLPNLLSEAASARVDWGELHSIDPEMACAAQELAKQYGYRQ